MFCRSKRRTSSIFRQGKGKGKAKAKEAKEAKAKAKSVPLAPNLGVSLQLIQLKPQGCCRIGQNLGCISTALDKTSKELIEKYLNLIIFDGRSKVCFSIPFLPGFVH